MKVADLVQVQLALFDLLRGIADHAKRAGHDVSAEQAVIIAAMPDDPTPIGMIARSTYAGTNLSYNLKRLEGLGYVAKEISPADSRSTLVTRTPAGKELAAEVRRFLSERRLSLEGYVGA